MHSEHIEYRDGDAVLEGYVAWDDAHRDRRPGVLVCHAWGGRDEFACGKAEALAQLGYVGFALDVYGKGIRGSSPEDNARLMAPWKQDRSALRRRLQAGVEAARRLEMVDPGRLAVIGFCFGGLCALDLARSGADLRGVVSFHGLFDPPEGSPSAEITARVLALHGWDDPMVPPDKVTALARELTAAGADWQIHAYGGAMHAFTNPKANNPDFGTVYDAAADQRSWRTMQAFLAEALAP